MTDRTLAQKIEATKKMIFMCQQMILRNKDAELARYHLGHYQKELSTLYQQVVELAN